MSAVVDRIILIADELDSGLPRVTFDDVDSIVAYGLRVRALAHRFRVAALALGIEWIAEDARQLDVESECDDLNASARLCATLKGLCDAVRDYTQDFGQDPSQWPAKPASGAINIFDHSPADHFDERFQTAPKLLTEKKAEKARLNESLAEPGTRRRGTYLRIILAMACAKYDYNPDASRSNATKGIMEHTDLYGIRVGDDTIRDVLREAHEDLRSDFTLPQ